MSAGVNATSDSIKVIEKQILELRSAVTRVHRRLESTDIDVSTGINFFDVKNNLLLDYMVNVTELLKDKCSGKSIADSPIFERLAEDRVYLEKMGKIESRMRFQVERLLRLVDSASQGEQPDVHLHRANPANMDSDSESNSSDEDADHGTAKKDKPAEDDGIYHPPRIVSAPYLEPEEKVEQVEKRAERKMMSAAALSELIAEHSEQPEEITERHHAVTSRGDSAAGASSRAKLLTEKRERTAYEETFFTRLPSASKAERKARAQQARHPGGLGELLELEGVLSMEMAAEASEGHRRRLLSALGKIGRKHGKGRSKKFAKKRGKSKRRH